MPIEQSGDWVAICSAATGGQEDEPDEELNPYNKEGALMVWNEDVHMLSGHFREWESYGNDGSVHIWTHNSDANSYDLEGTWKYQHVPHDLAFKPGGSVLAVAERHVHLLYLSMSTDRNCRRLNIYSNLSQGASVSRLSLFGKRSQHSVGAIIWGRGPTASNLYASSEPKEDDFTGFHKAFDAIEGKMIFAFDESGSGDTMDVTEDGRRLALLTRGKERTHSLRIYDIQDANPKAVLVVALEPFASEIEGEVNSAAFSSDGIYLALGRNDNRTHVYDSRRLDRLLFDYEHYGPCRTNPGGESYGVVKVQWVDRSTVTQNGLVTGGHDGCVRFWDPLSAHDSLDNGRILAEMNSDIGAFCIGDRYKGERPLVVGDCTGEVSIFDTRPAGFHSLYR
ncbi:hypothetical protein D9615_003544 [Tricholomella constricta]|uniref:WD40 repeat-like protein n=1 Tax=Tricholomella constricta TaxID=117010 RepID=A0A8H5HI54_9AGAR|nr:hypothetical protein D9615_003544 [Tricholomella constricta]